MNKISTPMLDKKRAVKDDSQKLGDFLYWLSEQRIILARFSTQPYLGEGYVPLSESLESLLARYFDIDPQALEAERVTLLEELRKEKI